MAILIPFVAAHCHLDQQSPRGLILGEQDLASALRQVDAAASLKRRFYDQVLPQPGSAVQPNR
ncbi:MAG: hypothetical protein VKN83_07115 [Cyanobacteriota bacterium]|nr:hypothetical protein [Cyanobacteriota bacterium]